MEFWEDNGGRGREYYGFANAIPYSTYDYAPVYHSPGGTAHKYIMDLVKSRFPDATEYDLSFSKNYFSSTSCDGGCDPEPILKGDLWKRKILIEL